jgi:hypothetical protein
MAFKNATTEQVARTMARAHYRRTYFGKGSDETQFVDDWWHIWIADARLVLSEIGLQPSEHIDLTETKAPPAAKPVSRSLALPETKAPVQERRPAIEVRPAIPARPKPKPMSREVILASPAKPTSRSSNRAMPMTQLAGVARRVAEERLEAAE